MTESLKSWTSSTRQLDDIDDRSRGPGECRVAIVNIAECGAPLVKKLETVGHCSESSFVNVRFLELIPDRSERVTFACPAMFVVTMRTSLFQTSCDTVAIAMRSPCERVSPSFIFPSVHRLRPRCRLKVLAQGRRRGQSLLVENQPYSSRINHVVSVARGQWFRPRPEQRTAVLLVRDRSGPRRLAYRATGHRGKTESGGYERMMQP